MRNVSTLLSSACDINLTMKWNYFKMATNKVRIAKNLFRPVFQDVLNRKLQHEGWTEFFTTTYHIQYQKKKN